MLIHVKLLQALQAPPSMALPRQGHWSGLPFPSPGDPPDPGIEPGSSALQADSPLTEPPGKPTCRQKLSQMIMRDNLSVVGGWGVGDFPGDSVQETRAPSLDWEEFLPGELHGQRGLAGHSPQGHRESDTPEGTKHALSVRSKVSATQGQSLACSPRPVVLRPQADPH